MLKLFCTSCAARRVIRVGLLGSYCVSYLVYGNAFVVFPFVLHGAKHFWEKFGDSWPEAGPEQLDKMYG